MSELQRWSHKSLRQVITRRFGVYCWFWDRFSVALIFCHFSLSISLSLQHQRENTTLHWVKPHQWSCADLFHLECVPALPKLGKFLFFCWKYNCGWNLNKTEYLIGCKKWYHTFSVAWLLRKTDLDNLLCSQLPQGRVWSEEPCCTIATAGPTSCCFPLLKTGKKRVIHAVHGERLTSKPIFGSLPVLKCLSFHGDVRSLCVCSY